LTKKIRDRLAEIEREQFLLECKPFAISIVPRLNALQDEKRKLLSKMEGEKDAHNSNY